MRTVFKYFVPTSEVTVLKLRGDVKHVGLMNNEIFVWAEHSDDKPEVEYHLQVFGTGRLIPRGAIHIGTVIVHDTYVWHIYQVG